MDTAKPQPIEIFRAGRHVDMSGTEHVITAADVADMAASYDAALHEAPLVIGHPDLNAPAYGWVSGLRAEDGVLLADTHQVDPAFAEVVNAGRFKKRSASFLRPNSPANPTPGRFYLNHVGFLGAQAPAVKGLRDAQFAAREELVEFASDRRWAFRDMAGVLRRLRDWFIEREGAEAADKVIPAWHLDSLAEAAAPDPEPTPMSAFAAPLPQEPSMSQTTTQQTADFAARERTLSDQAAALVAREQALAEREQKARRADVSAFAAGLVQSGRLLPREVATVTELLLVLPSDQPINLAAPDGGAARAVAPADALREFLSGLSPRVDFAEKSATSTAPASANFAAPAGQAVDAAGMELHNKALAYQQQHAGVGYLAAVKAVGG